MAGAQPPRGDCPEGVLFHTPGLESGQSASAWALLLLPAAVTGCSVWVPVQGNLEAPRDKDGCYWTESHTWEDMGSYKKQTWENPDYILASFGLGALCPIQLPAPAPTPHCENLRHYSPKDNAVSQEGPNAVCSAHPQETERGVTNFT